MAAVTVTSGVRAVCGSQLKYDLYVPDGLATPLPGVLLLHGFGMDRRSLSGHAMRLASAGVAAVLSPDMSSLLAGEAAQARNVAQAVSWASWLRGLPQLGGSAATIALCGHSAGGAVLFEAAEAVAAEGPLRGVLLLDAVPWPRTFAAAARFPAASVPLVALRGAEDAWNKSNEFKQCLERVPPPGACIAFLPRSRHGDAIDPKRNEWALRLAGLLGAPGSSELIVAVMDAFLRDALGPAPGGFEAGPLTALAAAHPGELVVERRRGGGAAAAPEREAVAR
jgi:acetyl esterase/lipase